ncbi:uncharacterized protein LOC108733988 isoform X2 [Agrilus planipennis]|uniref:Uncharacterized protein LOC108733988 isoform X2 n=1 Tax=Agrilus planipennis TaxID=224129 RepID=A0A1W4WLD9_AGRPL|nr:uncharacterized protein LOC108733988 isoform X2 [Agrilus planipennis]
MFPRHFVWLSGSTWIFRPITTQLWNRQHDRSTNNRLHAIVSFPRFFIQFKIVDSNLGTYVYYRRLQCIYFALFITRTKPIKRPFRQWYGYGEQYEETRRGLMAIAGEISLAERTAFR